MLYNAILWSLRIVVLLRTFLIKLRMMYDPNQRIPCTRCSLCKRDVTVFFQFRTQHGNQRLRLRILHSVFQVQRNFAQSLPDT